MDEEGERRGSGPVSTRPIKPVAVLEATARVLHGTCDSFKGNGREGGETRVADQDR